MSSSASAPSAAPDRRRGRWIALALFAFVALPVLAAFAAYFFWSPGRGINYGELLEPRALPDAELRERDGSPWRLSSLRGRWVLVHVAGGRCDEPCVRRHFAMRQARLMQGREVERVERVWLLADEVEPDAKLLAGYDGMRLARHAAPLLAAFPADSGDRIYVIDPLGNLMLRFPADADAMRMSKDLARLLRVSHVG
jgi:hypothetical protein